MASTPSNNGRTRDSAKPRPANSSSSAKARASAAPKRKPTVKSSSIKSSSGKGKATASPSAKPAAKAKTSKAGTRSTKRKPSPVSGAAVRERLKDQAEGIKVTVEAPKPVSGAVGAAQGLKPDKMALYGQALWLLGRSPAHRNLFILDLDWLILPPIALGQCRLWRQQGVPVGFASWAYVTTEVSQRIQSEMNAGRVPKLAPQEWRCGEQVFLMDMVAPFGGAEKFLEDLNSSVFKDVPIKLRA